MLDIGLTTLADLCRVGLTSKYIRIPDSILDYISLIFSEIPYHRSDDIIRELIRSRIVERCRDCRIQEEKL